MCRSAAVVWCRETMGQLLPCSRRQGSKPWETQRGFVSKSQHDLPWKSLPAWCTHPTPGSQLFSKCCTNPTTGSSLRSSCPLSQHSSYPSQCPQQSQSQRPLGSCFPLLLLTVDQQTRTKGGTTSQRASQNSSQMVFRTTFNQDFCWFHSSPHLKSDKPVATASAEALSLASLPSAGQLLIVQHWHQHKDKLVPLVPRTLLHMKWWNKCYVVPYMTYKSEDSQNKEETKCFPTFFALAFFLYKQPWPSWSGKELCSHYVT